MLKGYESKFSKVQKYNVNDFRLYYDNIERELSEGNFNYILILGWIISLFESDILCC